MHTHTVPSAGVQNATCSTFSILWERAVTQQLRIGTQCQYLEIKHELAKLF